MTRLAQSRMLISCATATSVQISKRGGELDVVMEESRVRIGGACSFYLEGIRLLYIDHTSIGLS